MDKIEEKQEEKELTTADVLYTIKDAMLDHHLSVSQVFYLLCKLNNIEYDADLADVTALYNKGLIVKNNVNSTLLFHLRKPKQLTLDLNFDSKPIGTDFTLDIADRIEKEFVIDKFLKTEERKRLADRYFKGDTSVSRYFIIFKSLFPVRRRTTNDKWNKKFGFIYEGIGLWDDSPRVAKKFHEVYRKLDIGVFLEATYTRVKDSIDFDNERCFMTKPFKYLTGFDSYYQDVLDSLEKRSKKVNKDTEKKIDKLKV